MEALVVARTRTPRSKRAFNLTAIPRDRGRRRVHLLPQPLASRASSSAPARLIPRLPRVRRESGTCRARLPWCAFWIGLIQCAIASDCGPRRWNATRSQKYSSSFRIRRIQLERFPPVSGRLSYSRMS